MIQIFSGCRLGKKNILNINENTEARDRPDISKGLILEPNNLWHPSVT